MANRKSAERREVELSAGLVRYLDVGDGPPLLFVHGVLANGRLWAPVVERLRSRYRCLVPDWPLGSHEVAMRPDADLRPPALAGLVVEFMDAVGLASATLVGSDAGGALCQLVAANHPDRVQRMVLTPCDAYENFPPPELARGVRLAARLPGGLWLLLQSMRVRLLWRLPFSFAGLAKQPLDPAVVESWVAPARRDRGVRRDFGKVATSTAPRYTMDAVAKLREFRRPVLLAWSPEARFLRFGDAQRLAADLPDARIEPIHDAYAYVSLDQPEQVARAICEFVPAR